MRSILAECQRSVGWINKLTHMWQLTMCSLQDSECHVTQLWPIHTAHDTIYTQCANDWTDIINRCAIHSCLYNWSATIFMHGSWFVLQCHHISAKLWIVLLLLLGDIISVWFARGVAGVRPQLEKPWPQLKNISKNAAGVALWPRQLTTAIREVRPDDRYFNFTLLFVYSILVSLPAITILT